MIKHKKAIAVLVLVGMIGLTLVPASAMTARQACQTCNRYQIHESLWSTDTKSDKRQCDDVNNCIVSDIYARVYWRCTVCADKWLSEIYYYKTTKHSKTGH